MIKKIAHFADIHVCKNTDRHDEYRKIFDKVYTKLKEQKPDRILIAGDTYNDFIDIEGEALVLIGELLYNLSNIAPVIVTKGNHDFRKKNRGRIDTVKTVTELLNNPRITYYNKSGFYKDENVTWVIWDHVENHYDKIFPWRDIQHQRDKEQVYIDVYHDPVNGCKYHTGYNPGNRQYPLISEFKGDYSMMGDIHVKQYLKHKNGKPTHGYPGSLIQQNFGEDPFGHGYLFWDIENCEVEETIIENEHAYIKIQINPGTDYDNLKIKPKHLSEYNEFFVEWTDYAALITNENENKIKKYLKEKFDPISIQVYPNRMYSDIKDKKLLSEILDINKKGVQQDIIKQYLKENKYDDDFINKIIDIDNIINDRLDLSDTKNIVWNIDKFWFNNFKSYGDNNIIEWDNINGIIQISGINQQGKTSIIDAICFILYGTTVSTTKNEKYGNNRYINKNRKLDYCDGGCVLDVNGEKYIMYRRVDREYKKQGDIKSCSMTLDYYKGTEIDEKNKLTDERKTSTQKLLDSVLGNFNDFIRMSLTNADNLNSLLSMDRSEFIDSIIKDAGYDIFEIKLNEFKEYKKELNLEKINVNVQDTEKEIEKLKNDISDKKDFIKDIEEDIKNIENKIKENNKLKEQKLIKIHKINDELLNLNIEDIDNDIQNLNDKLLSNKNGIFNIDGACVFLADTFDNDKLELYIKNHDKFNKERNNKNIELIELKAKLSGNENIINNVDKDIESEKERYVNNIKSRIEEEKNYLKTILNNINLDHLSKKSEIEKEMSSLKNEINLIKSDGLKLKEEMSSYENMLNSENAICPACNQIIINKDDVHINKIIENCNEKLRELAKTGKSKINEISEKENYIKELNTKKENDIKLKTEEIDSNILNFKDLIDNFNNDLIKENIEKIEEKKNLCIKENELIKETIRYNTKFIDRVDKEIDKIYHMIEQMKKDKLSYEEYKNLQHKKEIIITNNEKIERNIKEKIKLLEEYKKNENLIKENEFLEKSIKEYNLILENITYRKSELLNDKLSYSNDMTLLVKVKQDLELKLSKYIKQIKLEELHNSYLKLMHRTGLPTYLLTKNIDILNIELSDLLANNNFTLFFDDELNLKLKHNGLSGVINAIESSGYERTMCAVILKQVLRIINFKSKCNIIFLDEVLNKCVGKSVDIFLELLETMKKKIDKIIIIEHNNEIQSDMIINIVKDENGISKFEII